MPRPILPRRATPILAALAVCLGTVAQADVVHLTNGRKIEGEVLDQGEGPVVVKTLAGRIVVPRREVARVERHSQVRSLLGQARQAAQGGQRALAARLLEQGLAAAAEEPDPRAEDAARRLLAELRAASDGHDDRGAEGGASAAPGEGAGEDPLLEPREEEAFLRELQAALQAAGDQPRAEGLRRRLAHELFRRGGVRHERQECARAVSDFRRAGELLEGEQVAAVRTHEHRCRLEVAGRALRARDGHLARAAAGPVAELGGAGVDPRGAARARYLLGRACELVNRRDEARRAFTAALGGLEVPDDLELVALRELARLAGAGLPIGADAPGLSGDWRSHESRHFVVLQREGQDPQLATQLEQMRSAVLQRLRLRTQLGESERVAVFFYANEAEYRAAPGAYAWSAGHATRIRGEDEVVRAIYLYPDAEFERRARHEIAHIVVGDALDDARIPAWASEGVAIYAEPDASRVRWRAEAKALAQRGVLEGPLDAFGTMLFPQTDAREHVFRFYVQAGLLFGVLADRVGPVRALDAASKINREGTESALRSVGLPPAGFAREVQTASGVR